MNGAKDELQALEEKSLRRHLRTIDQIEGACVWIGGTKLINFASNNYLGLARHPQVSEAVRQVLEHWGTGAASSRLLSGNSVIHQDLESALAAYVGQESALLFPTGYQANLGAVTALVRPGDAIIMDRLCHASLVDAARLSGTRLFVYTHADAAGAERALARAASYRRRLLVTESLFSMDGDFAPLADLLRLAKKYEALALVDEAHALGVWDLAKGWDITIGTLSKALGSQGGFVAGSRELIDTLINKARSFIYTTGLAPTAVAAAQAALSLMQEDHAPGQVAAGDQYGQPLHPKGVGAPRRHVQELSAKLRAGLSAQGWNTLQSQSQIVPILLKDARTALEIAHGLQEAGIFAPAIRPPTVAEGECRIRFSITAEHNEVHIDQLLAALSTLIPQPPSPLSREKGKALSILKGEGGSPDVWRPGEGEA